MSGNVDRNRPRIVATDGHTLNPGDLSWEVLESLGQLTVYDYTPAEKVVERSLDAEILLVNKTLLGAEAISALPRLRCICVTATGYNNVDVAAAAQRGVPVCNAVGYGSDSVAQHVFALLLDWSNHVARHDASVKRGDWSRQPHFTYHLAPLRELAGKVFGIYGLGRIGQQAARIAQGFGMSVLAAHKHPRRDAMPGVRFVDLTTLFSQSDVVSLHAPLGPDNEGIVNEKLLRLAKPSAILINTSRGGLINEADLERALRGGWLAAAALDVLKQEPPGGDHPLLALDNCRLTPHLAWATFEARERLMGITADNVAAFLEGQPQNVVNGVMARPA